MFDYDISVVIPFYYGNKYINQCLNSVCKSWMHSKKKGNEIKCEIIIVNDSPLVDPQINVDYDIRVRVYNNLSNQGIQISRINGIKRSNGEYVIMLDQDDTIEESCLLLMMLKARAEKSDMVIGNGGVERDDGSSWNVYKNERVQKKCAGNIWMYILLGNQIASPGQVMLKRAAIPQMWYDSHLRNNGSDDALLWMLMLINKKRISFVYDIVYKHRYTGENVSDNKMNMYLSSSEYIDIIAKSNELSTIKCYFLQSRKYWMSIENNIVNKLGMFKIIDYLSLRLFCGLCKKLLGNI